MTKVNMSTPSYDRSEILKEGRIKRDKGVEEGMTGIQQGREKTHN